ncbi:MAG: hypothetical protein IJW96_03870 [Clostridia bacterium]|nr:hypothetical protein [Clostridia bacterium]
MALVFAKDERVVKSYDYATVSTTKGLSEDREVKSLIITNKRIIHRCSSHKHIVQSEMPITKATYFECAYQSVRHPGMLFLCILFLLLGAGAFVGMNFIPLEVIPTVLMDKMIYLPIALLVISLLFFIIWLVTKKGAINCTFSTDGMKQPVMQVASNPLVDLLKKFSKKQKGKVKVVVDAHACAGMVDELGAVLLNIQAEQEKKTPKAPVVIVQTESKEAKQAEEKYFEQEEEPVEEMEEVDEE